MRKTDDTGSIYPVVIIFIAICIAGFLVLLFGNILAPFGQILNSTDTSIIPEILIVPHTMFILLFQWIWPKGLLYGILFGLIAWLIMDYQKNRYKEAF